MGRFIAALHRAFLRRNIRTTVTQTKAASEPDLTPVVACVEIANRMFAAGEPDAAQRYYDQALTQYRELCGDDDPNVLVLRFTQAQDCMRRGDVERAREILRDICQIAARVLGPDHPSTFLYRHSLFAALLRTGDLYEASVLISVLLETCAERPEIDAEPAISAASVLVTTFLNENRWAESVEVQERTVEVLKDRRGAGDVDTLLASSLLAIMYVETQQVTKARVLLQALSGACTRVFGRSHRETLRTFLLLAVVLEREGDIQQARAVAERSYYLAEREHGLGDEVVIRLGTKLANLLITLEEYPEAERLLLALVPAAERQTGKDSALTLTNLNNLGAAAWFRGRHKAARSIAAEVVERKRRVFGNDHADTRAAEQQYRAMCPGQPSDPDILEIEDEIEIANASLTLRLRSFQLPKGKN